MSFQSYLNEKHQLTHLEHLEDLVFIEGIKGAKKSLEYLKNITDEIITTYKQGDFEDLCRGPHMPNTRMIRNFKLIRVAGAYLGGDEDNEMITRIYGISFFDKKELKDF